MTGLLKSNISRRSKIVFIAVLMVMATSCSFKTLYNQLDVLIPSYVEGLVSLDSVLEKKVDQRTLVLINWHRGTQLNQYAHWLRGLQGDANKKLNEKHVLQHIATMEDFWQAILLRINEEMVILLPLLNAEQRQQLFANIEDKNEDFREDYVDVDNAERIEQYADRMLEHYETWLGNLTDDQESAIEQAATQLGTSAELRLQRRQQWQRSIKAIIETSDSAEKKSHNLRDFFARFDMRDDPAMRNTVKLNKNIVARLTVEIVRSMTARQQAHFVSVTNEYIQMFAELAEQH